MINYFRGYLNRNFGTRILSKWIVLCFDIVVTIFTYAIAYILRFNFSIASISFGHFVQDTLLTAGIYTIAYFIFKSYDGIIRHSGIADVIRLIKAGVTATILCLALSTVTRYVGDGTAVFPASIAIIHVVLNITLLSVSRYMIKALFYTSSKNLNIPVSVIIYGAGRRGISVLQALKADMRMNYHIVAFLDDNSSKINKTIEGVKILHSSKFESLIKKYPVSELIISIQDLDNKRKNEIVDISIQHRIAVKYTPHVYDWMNGKLNPQQIRRINIEDLLERDPIYIENGNMHHELNKKTILITGAAGSIGSELVRQVLHYQPAKLVLLDQAESDLFDVRMELFFKLEQLPEDTVEFIICDITNLPRIRWVFETYRPQVVFHAAAYKHVPLMESNPFEAIHVNVFGTKHVIDLSVAHGVEKFVMISTDKAVNPVNVMGASKRIAEIYARDKSLAPSCRTTFITTRFGNVLGSNGSAVIYFQKQIENGGPVTITHPEVTRYFMTISEACQLVLEAATMGKGSEIYLFDMGDSVKVLDLAKKMILLSGLTPEKDIQFVFTGLRPGEKLHEELLYDDENVLPTHHHKIKIAKTAEYPSEWVAESMQRLQKALTENDTKKLISVLKEIVPELSNQPESTILRSREDTSLHMTFH